MRDASTNLAGKPEWKRSVEDRLRCDNNIKIYLKDIFLYVVFCAVANHPE
jgi:hypothetical protein